MGSELEEIAQAYKVQDEIGLLRDIHGTIAITNGLLLEILEALKRH